MSVQRYELCRKASCLLCNVFQSSFVPKSQDLLLNLYSAKATLETILQQHDSALEALEMGLQVDGCHVGLLIRRSQAFKKQNKIRKAMENLDKVAMFTRDSRQIIALRVELENLLLKNPKIDQYEDICNEEQLKFNIERRNEKEGDSEKDEQDQEAMVQFSNLKCIDRRSSSILNNLIERSLIKENSTEVDLIEQNDQENKSIGSQDEGSFHRIFGKQQFVLCKEIGENFGLDIESNKKIKVKKERSNGGKFILKKGFIFVGQKELSQFLMVKFRKRNSRRQSLKRA